MAPPVKVKDRPKPSFYKYDTTKRQKDIRGFFSLSGANNSNSSAPKAPTSAKPQRETQKTKPIATPSPPKPEKEKEIPKAAPRPKKVAPPVQDKENKGEGEKPRKRKRAEKSKSAAKEAEQEKQTSDSSVPATPKKAANKGDINKRRKTKAHRQMLGDAKKKSETRAAGTIATRQGSALSQLVSKKLEDTSLQKKISTNKEWRADVEKTSDGIERLIEKAQQSGQLFEKSKVKTVQFARVMKLLNDMISPKSKELMAAVEQELDVTEDMHNMQLELEAAFDPDLKDSQFDNLQKRDKRVLLSMFLVYSKSLLPKCTQMVNILEKIKHDYQEITKGLKSMKKRCNNISKSNAEFVASVLENTRDQSARYLANPGALGITSAASSTTQTVSYVFNRPASVIPGM